jgi:hypothetical protein
MGYHHRYGEKLTAADCGVNPEIVWLFRLAGNAGAISHGDSPFL